MKKYILTIVTALMLSLTAGAQVIKGTLRIGDKDIAAEFLQLSDNTVAVGNGRNACVSQYESNGLLTIPSEVTVKGATYKVVEVSPLAFRLCNGITGVNIKENVRKIGDYAFIGCYQITDITLPASMESLGAGVFYSCFEKLQTVTCLATTPPRWEYNDVFKAHEKGIGDDQPALIGTAKKLYVPDESVYRTANYTNPDIGWTTPDGWSSFAMLQVGQPIFYIYSVADLNLFRMVVNGSGSSYAPIKHAYLEADIDMTGQVWDGGIGLSETEPYFGSFDGKGHTISNLTIKSDETVGFFSHFGGERIDNVAFKNCQVTNSSVTGYCSMVVGESGHLTMKDVWVENCTLTGGKYMGALVGHNMHSSTSILDCVVKDNYLNIWPVIGVKAGSLAGLVAGCNIWRCAVIGYHYDPDYEHYKGDDAAKILYPWDLDSPFVGLCTADEELQIHNSYTTSSHFNGFPPSANVTYDNAVYWGNTTLDIVDADGQARQLKVKDDEMKTLFMVPLLGEQFIYQPGQFPLPVSFRNHFTAEVNKATYIFDTDQDEEVNRLFWYGGDLKLFLDRGPNGYRSKEFKTSKIWIDDHFTSDDGMLPIGTATIYSRNGVIYDRTLTAPASAIAVEKAQLVDVDKDGEVAITAHGNYDFIDDEVIVSAEKAYEPKGYNVCLPYSIQLNGSTHVYYPAGIQERDGLQVVTMAEGEMIEAWRPCLVTVAQESLPLGTSAQVVFKPKTADSDFKPAGSPYAMIGTPEAKAADGLNYFSLDDNDLWTYTNPSTLLPFRSYFTSTGTDRTVAFTTGMGYRAELVNDTLMFRKGLPLTAEAEGMSWWFVDHAYNNTDDDYFEHLVWRPIAEQVKVVEFDPSFINARPKIMEGWFYGFRYLNTIAGLEYLNTSQTESMFRLFGGCDSLTKLDLSHFDTHQVSYMHGMFEDCTSLKKIIIGNDWEIGTYAQPIEMFKGCTSIVGQYGKTYDANQTSHEYAHAGPDGYLWKDYSYYVAVNSGNGTLTFKGSDTAPDGTTAFDATNTGNGKPAWYYDDFQKAVVEPSFLLARPASCSYWFAQGLNASQGIQTIEGLENLNTSRVSTMKGMFTNCQQATLDVSHFNTHFVTDMSEMFENCTNLTALDVSHFNTANVTTMEKMFAGCEKLAALDVTGLKTFNVEAMNGMFSACSALTELDLNNFNVGKLANTSTMFFRCSALRTIWCDQSWNDISQSANMFARCDQLEGAVKYTESTTTLDGRMANPNTGYFMGSDIVSLLDAGDNSEVFAKYGGKTVNVEYDRILRATLNSDGTWKRKAYTICLPYDLNVVKDWVEDRVDIYTLYDVKDNQQFVFSESMDGGVLKAGHAYLVVMNEGVLSLNANRVTFTSQPHPGQEVYDWDGDVLKGKWRGTFTKIESADAAAMLAYSLQSDGYFKRIRPDTPQAWWGAFRATFCADAFSGNNVFKPVYKKYIAGDDSDDPFVDLTDDESTGIISIDDDTLTIDDGTGVWYDLQGRKLSGQPTGKGIYIYKGKKVIR